MTARAKSDRTFKTSLLWWFRGVDDRAVQREVARLLENPVESRIFAALPTPTAAAAVERVCWVESRRKLKPHFLFVPRLARYNVEAAYEQAKAKADVAYSPHTAFRSLKSGNEWAIDFLNKFGPLDLLDEQQPRQRLEREDLVDFASEPEDDIKERCVWVDLDDFWDKQRRFVSVAKLWELRGSYDKQVDALSEWAARVDRPGVWPRRLGCSLASGPRWSDDKFRQWAAMVKVNPKRAAAAAADTIKGELNLHCYEMKSQWTCPDPHRLEFRIVPTATSLWAAIWHLFARDTSEGPGWRVCRHCAKLFYPKRKDSYFCESKYQKLYAARRWWEEHKDGELANRRKERAEQTEKDSAKH